MALFRIGDLARLGGASVRMLRHYHQLGIVEPDHVDAVTGYRSYRSEQVETVRQIVRLRKLGLSLDDIGVVVGNDATDGQFHEILHSRRAELIAEIEAARRSLDEIDRQLADRPQETQMTTPTPDPTSALEFELKSVEPRLVAQLSAVSESWAPEDIGPTIQPLYPELTSRMEAADVAIAGPSTAWYEDTDDGRIHVHATLTIAERPSAPESELGFEIVELPAIDEVASTIHRGTMDDCDTTYQALLEWIAAQGLTAVGYSREIDIECGPGRQWITELQMAVER